MDKETLNRANEITKNIALLKKEIHDLEVNPTIRYVKEIRRVIIPKVYSDITIDLSEEDAGALIELRKKKVAELEEELKSL